MLNVVDINIRFQVAALLLYILMLIDYIRNSHLKLLSTKCFVLILILVGANLIFDITTVYTISHPSVPMWFNRFAHQLFIGSIVVILFVNCLYAYILANDQKRLGFKETVILSIPILISAVFLVFGDLNYVVDGVRIYSYGSMANTIYVCGILYLIVTFVITIDKKNSLTENQRASIQIGLGIWCVILMVQMIIRPLLLSGLALTLLTLSVYFTLESQKENYDTVIKCFNNNAYDRMLAEYVETGKNSLYLIDVTCDNFEHIKSILGHDKGIECLLCIKEILEKYFGKNIYYSKSNSLSVLRKSDVSDEVLNSLLEEISDINLEGIKIRTHIKVMDFRKTKYDKNYVYVFSEFMSEELKGSKSGIYRLTQEMLDKKFRRDRIGQLVADALKNDGFEMFYQPIYNTKTQTFNSAEALLRLKNTQDMGFISPEEFIPIAEEKGMIIELGDRVFELVARDIKACNMENMGIEYVEVNLSRIQTVTLNIAAHLEKIIAKYGLTPNFFNVEITETAAVQSDEVLSNNMKQLKEKGFGISMDDFGTGYSNLEQINKAEYELIKLDKSMIWPAFDENLSADSKTSSEKLLIAAIHIAKAMNVKIVAEGVETEDMVNYLINQDVEYLQGYYYSRPLNREKFTEFVKSKL